MTGKSERPSKRPSGALSNLGAADAKERSASSLASKQSTAIAPGLYVVATPIGNARDITLRALDLLQAADVIACEDTRVTSKLLAIHGISHTPLLSYHDHNAPRARPKVMEHLKSGKIVALVSDAGTPLVNDPGFDLIQACREEDIPVHALPGASAVTTALVLAGLPTDRFIYCGFPPPKSAKRRTWLGDVRSLDVSLVFLESAKRLAASLADMADVFGDRPAAVMREMTKTFEETQTGTLRELAAFYGDQAPPRGEITLVVGPPIAGADTLDETELETRLTDLLKKESVREASARLALETGTSKKRLYDLALSIKRREDAQ